MTSKELKIMLDDNYDKAMNYNLVPKDWKPYCYDEEHNICSLVGLVNEPPKCWKECPYRKRSD